jgi:MFS family permease
MAARFFLTLGVQIQSVTVAMQVCDLTGDALMLGLIGLTEALPFIVFSLYTGYLADVMSRKRIIVFAIAFLTLASLLLFYISFNADLLRELGASVIFGLTFCIGIARGFLGPVFPAYLSQLIPRHLYANASTWQSNLWQTAAVAGPAAGGLIKSFSGAGVAYGIAAGLIGLGFILINFVTNHPLPPREEKEKLALRLTAGFRFVFKNQIMLSAFSLDLFAVLLGGAVSILPLFAREVLHLGAEADFWTGVLRAAPAVGAIIMGIFMAYNPPTRKAGRNLFIAVIGFGLCIIGFAFSRNVFLSFGLLMLSGAFDCISVIIRSTILQLLTPDDMRGRVAAVNGIFIGSSNEIGEFESGVAAKLLGLVPSVFFGGTMTILVVIAVIFLAPKLRKLNLDEYV